MLFLAGQCNGKIARYPQIRILLRSSVDNIVKITDYRINLVKLQLQSYIREWGPKLTVRLIQRRASRITTLECLVVCLGQRKLVYCVQSASPNLLINYRGTAFKQADHQNAYWGPRTSYITRWISPKLGKAVLMRYQKRASSVEAATSDPEMVT